MIKSLIIYTQFFSRIRINRSIDIVYLRKGVPFLSLFGLLLGLLSASFYLGMTLVFPTSVAWLLTLFFEVLLTGGFHLDALADMADGLFSSRSKEQMLTIMKDSRIGSNGVLALIFYYGLMVAIFPHLPEPTWFLVASLSMIGKAGLSLQLYQMNYARKDGGTGQFFKGTKTSHIVIGQLLPLLLLYLFFQGRGLLSYALVVLGSVVYRRFVYSKIGGHTGDTLGAFVEISHLLFLIGVVLW